MYGVLHVRHDRGVGEKRRYVALTIAVRSRRNASVTKCSRSDAQVLSDIRKIVGDCEYVPTDPKQLCYTILVTCYMGTENSSTETKSRAAELAGQIGSYHHGIVIDVAVSAILTTFQQVTKLSPRFKARGGSPRESLALQNIQVNKTFLKFIALAVDIVQECDCLRHV